MVAGNQLRFSLSHIKGGAVEFGGGAGDEHESGQWLHQQERDDLGVDHFRQRHRPGQHHHAQQRNDYRHFVADEHRHAPGRAEQRKAVVGSPPRHKDGDGSYGGYGQDIQHADVEVGQGGVFGERHHRQHQHHRGQHRHRHGGEHQPVGGARHQVFFEQQFQQVGDGLQQAERPPAVGAEAVLELADEPPFQPGKAGGAQQHGVDQQQDNHETGHEIGQPAGQRLPHEVIHLAEERRFAQDVVGSQQAVQRSTSPILMSRLPRVTIISASRNPTSRCSVTVRLMREGERILQR